MPDRIKARLDADWHDFLDDLNRVYEASYESTMKHRFVRERAKRVYLMVVEWTDGDDLRIGLGVELETDGGRHDS